MIRLIKKLTCSQLIHGYIMYPVSPKLVSNLDETYNSLLFNYSVWSIN